MHRKYAALRWKVPRSKEPRLARHFLRLEWHQGTGSIGDTCLAATG
jgi:hypothetical protein